MLTAGHTIKKDYAANKIMELTANEWLGHSIPFEEYDPTTLDILRDLTMKMVFSHFVLSLSYFGT